MEFSQVVLTFLLAEPEGTKACSNWEREKKTTLAHAQPHEFLKSF